MITNGPSYILNWFYSKKCGKYRNLEVDMGDVSVAFEEVSRSDWGEQVYKKEIRDNENVYLKPNYEYK